jgi:hypothetical protein
MSPANFLKCGLSISCIDFFVARIFFNDEAERAIGPASLICRVTAILAEEVPISLPAKI